MPKHPALDTETAVRDYVRAQLRAAVPDPGHGWHWPALTTGQESRVIVLRDVSDDGATLTWYTDRRSAKAADLQRSPVTSLLFYHGKHRTQLRLRGRSRELSDAGERERRWASVGKAARVNYATVEAPGTLLPHASRGLPATWSSPTSEQTQRAFSNFAVYRTRVRAADFLQLLDVGAFRSQWDAGGFSFVTP